MTRQPPMRHRADRVVDEKALSAVSHRGLLSIVWQRFQIRRVEAQTFEASAPAIP